MGRDCWKGEMEVEDEGGGGGKGESGRAGP